MLRKQAEQKDCKDPLQDSFSVLSSEEGVTRSQNSGLEALIMCQKGSGFIMNCHCNEACLYYLMKLPELPEVFAISPHSDCYPSFVPETIFDSWED